MNSSAQQQSGADEAFFVDVRSRNLDDVLAGRITFDQYFNEVDRHAKESSEGRGETAAANARLDSLQRVINQVAFVFLVGLLPLVYITIAVIPFRESGSEAIRLLSILTAVAISSGTILLRSRFDFLRGHGIRARHGSVARMKHDQS